MMRSQGPDWIESIARNLGRGRPASAPACGEQLRRFDVERRLALLLTVSAVLAGLATYVAISRSPPYGPDVGTVLVLLNLDLILLLLLGVVIARRLTRSSCSSGRARPDRGCTSGSCCCSAASRRRPRSSWSVFSVFFFSTGLENWFSERVRDALDNSLSVAEAYLSGAQGEHPRRRAGHGRRPEPRERQSRAQPRAAASGGQCPGGTALADGGHRLRRLWAGPGPHRPLLHDGGRAHSGRGA